MTSRLSYGAYFQRLLRDLSIELDPLLVQSTVYVTLERFSQLSWIDRHNHVITRTDIDCRRSLKSECTLWLTYLLNFTSHNAINAIAAVCRCAIMLTAGNFLHCQVRATKLKIQAVKRRDSMPRKVKRSAMPGDVCADLLSRARDRFLHSEFRSLRTDVPYAFCHLVLFLETMTSIIIADRNCILLFLSHQFDALLK